MKTVTLRLVALSLLLGGVLLVLGPNSAKAAVSSVPLTGTGVNGPLNATATFNTDTAGILTITLTNNLSASTIVSAGQAISDLGFTLSTTPSGTVSGSASGQLVTVSSGGNTVAAAGTPDRWVQTSDLTPSGSTFELSALGGGPPSQLVLPTSPIGTASYPAANSSITSNFSPWVDGTLTLTLTNTAFNSGTTVSDVSISFGTSPETILPIVPEPSSLAIAGLGALGFIGYGLRRRLTK